MLLTILDHFLHVVDADLKRSSSAQYFSENETHQGTTNRLGFRFGKVAKMNSDRCNPTFATRSRPFGVEQTYFSFYAILLVQIPTMWCVSALQTFLGERSPPWKT